MSPSIRPACYAALGLLSVAALVGCSGGDSNDASGTSPAASTVSTSASEPPAETTSAATTSSSTRCTTDDLTGKIIEVEPAAGQRYAELLLENTSAEMCTIAGYGGAQLVAADGTDLPTNLVRDTSVPASPVVLQPGDSAQSQLHWSVVAGTGDDQGADCQPTAVTLAVIPPDETTALDAPWTFGPVCEQGRIVQQPYVNAM